MNPDDTRSPHGSSADDGRADSVEAAEREPQARPAGAEGERELATGDVPGASDADASRVGRK
jgi:hypothetical protein